MFTAVYSSSWYVVLGSLYVVLSIGCVPNCCPGTAQEVYRTGRYLRFNTKQLTISARLRSLAASVVCLLQLNSSNIAITVAAQAPAQLHRLFAFVFCQPCSMDGPVPVPGSPRPHSVHRNELVSGHLALVSHTTAVQTGYSTAVEGTSIDKAPVGYLLYLYTYCILRSTVLTRRVQPYVVSCTTQLKSTSIVSSRAR